MNELDHQVELFRWARLHAPQYPALQLLFAIPNGGLRNAVVARKLKAAGVERGVPDICLPVARNPYHGFWIELKRPEKSHVTAAQHQWIDRLNAEGYRAEICTGWVEAVNRLVEYLDLPLLLRPYSRPVILLHPPKQGEKK